MGKTEKEAWRLIAKSKDGSCQLLWHPDEEGYRMSIEHGRHSSFRVVTKAEGLAQIQKWDAPDDIPKVKGIVKS